MRLVLASNNAHKLAELQLLLQGAGVDLVAQGTLGIGEADEPHSTFIENALTKARQAAAAAGCAALADDSGLCVDALGGQPGVVSAHYAAVALAPADREAQRSLQDAANNALLLRNMHGIADRSAHFISTLVAVRHAQDPQPLVAVGRWRGLITQAPRGSKGFGYNPVVFIPDCGCTVAELDDARKNTISHRALAAAQMLALLRDVWRL